MLDHNTGKKAASSREKGKKNKKKTYLKLLFYIMNHDKKFILNTDLKIVTKTL